LAGVHGTVSQQAALLALRACITEDGYRCDVPTAAIAWRRNKSLGFVEETQLT
jgi:hypothetical protein